MSTTPNDRNLACLIMAAGNASRYGSTKQLAELNGKPLIKYILDAAKPLFGNHIYCVLGANADTITPIIAADCQIIINDHWQDGLGSSIAQGVKEVTKNNNLDGLMVVLADQYRISTVDLSDMLMQFSAETIIATDYGDAAGVPAFFPRKYFDQLTELSGAHGAKELLKSIAVDVERITLSNALQDLDTPEDMAIAKQQLS